MSHTPAQAHAGEMMALLMRIDSYLRDAPSDSLDNRASFCYSTGYLKAEIRMLLDEIAPVRNEASE